MEDTISAVHPEEVKEELIQGNIAYIQGDDLPQAVMSSPRVRMDLATTGQKPLAAIVACSDSRVAPEIVFSVGMGLLFTIRNAGNGVCDRSVLGSLEYAVDHLKVPLVIVMGHSGCGAVTAALGVAKGQKAPNTPLFDYVSSMSEVVKKDVGSPEENKDGVLTNVRYGVNFLKSYNTPVREAYKKKAIDIVGAYYDQVSGQVFFMNR